MIYETEVPRRTKELKARIPIIRLYNRPTSYSKERAEQTDKMVAGCKEVSPGFDLAMKLVAYQQLSYGYHIDYPFGKDRFLEAELAAQQSSFLPTIGVELEIPLDNQFIHLDTAPYKNLQNLRLDSHAEGDNHWEFSLPPSYSWQAQALLLHSLLNMGYIPYRASSTQPYSPYRRVVAPELYSLHCNLGVPNRLCYSKIQSFTNVNNEANLLAVACGIAYSSAERIKNKKSPYWQEIDKENQQTDKSPQREINGRIELKTQGFGSIASFKQLAVIQDLGAAFFAYLLPVSSYLDRMGLGNSQHARLRRIWKQGRKELLSLFRDKYNIMGLTPSNHLTVDAVEQTIIKPETRQLLLTLRQQIRTTIETPN